MQLRVSSTRHLNNAGFFYASYSSLPEERKATVDKLRNDADKFRSITAGELLLDAFLDSYPKLSAEDIGGIGYGEHGKPYLINYPEWKYNLSHSGEYVAIAYDDTPIMSVYADADRQELSGHNFLPSEVTEIGVDIQSTRKISEGVANKILTAEELACIDKDTSECQPLLNALWSVKEAYIKFIGVGLSFDMKKVKIDATKSVFNSINSLVCADDRSLNEYVDMLLISSDSDYPDACCRYFHMEDGYHLSVCSGTDSLPYNITIVSAG